MNGWLAKKSDNWLIQIAIVCRVHSACGACSIWGHAPTEKFCKFSLFSIKFGNIF